MEYGTSGSDRVRSNYYHPCSIILNFDDMLHSMLVNIPIREFLCHIFEQELGKDLKFHDWRRESSMVCYFSTCR